CSIHGRGNPRPVSGISFSTNSLRRMILFLVVLCSCQVAKHFIHDYHPELLLRLLVTAQRSKNFSSNESLGDLVSVEATSTTTAVLNLPIREAHAGEHHHQ